MKKARELAAQGNSVLLLAYNRLLGEGLAESVKGVPNITANTYHDFCPRHLTEVGCQPIQENTQEYWRKTIPEDFAGYMREYSLQYDTVIIDEGLDFRVEYWLTIEKMQKPEDCFYILIDPNEYLYNTGIELPIKDDPLVLMDNCRE